MLNVERKLLTWGTFAALVATQAACSGETATQPTLGTAASSDTLVGDLATGGDGDAQAPSDATQALDAQEQDSGAQDVVGDTATVDAAPSDDALAGQDADNDSQVALDADPSKTDTDKDGLSDSEEVALGTDPNNADTDGDGLSDGEEVALGTDPKKPDTDGDGLTDGAEVNKYATDPLLPANVYYFSDSLFMADLSAQLGMPDDALAFLGLAAYLNAELPAVFATPANSSATCNAAVPLTTAMAWRAPVYSARLTSKRSTNWPTEETKVESRHCFT